MANFARPNGILILTVRGMRSTPENPMMKRTFLPLIAVAILGLFITACPKRTTIGEIEANPSKFSGKEVAVAGVVKDSYGVNIPLTSVRGGIYKLDDGTGSFWIITENAVPPKGARVGVKGRIGTGINWSGRNYGLGMYENDRRIQGK